MLKLEEVQRILAALAGVSVIALTALGIVTDVVDFTVLTEHRNEKD